MKKLYEVPLMETIQLFVTDDVICASGGTGLDPKEWSEETETTVDFGKWTQ